MKNNTVFDYINSEIWKNVNRIARNRKITLLYRGDYEEVMVAESKQKLSKHWSHISMEMVGDGYEKAIIINLEQ